MNANIYAEVAILVVDDDRDSCRMLKRILNNAGFNNVFTTDNLTTALERATDPRTGLVISDWNMPTMSGIDFLRQVRKERNKKELPFIMLTSNAGKEHIVEAMDSEVSDYVLKSTASRILPERVEKALKAKG